MKNFQCMYLLIYFKENFVNSNIREETIIFCGKLNIIDLTMNNLVTGMTAILLVVFVAQV